MLLTKFSGLTYKSRAKWKMLRRIYSDIYGEVNVSVSVWVEIMGDFDVSLTVHHSIDFSKYQLSAQFFQSSTIYICYTTLLNMFRAARRPSSGGPIVSPQPLVSSPSVSSLTVCEWRADSSPLSTRILYCCLQRVKIPEAVVIQLILLMMGGVLFETC